MKAVYIERYGSNDVVKLGDLPKPELRPADLLVGVKSCQRQSGGFQDAGGDITSTVPIGRLTRRSETAMTNNEMWDAPDIVPSITYADLSRAIEWLERACGSLVAPLIGGLGDSEHTIVEASIR